MITATPSVLATPAGQEGGSEAEDASADAQRTLADELVAMAHQTAAKVTFIEDPALLREVGGVGALLRFRV